MSVKRITVDIRHTFELDIPDELFNDDDGWALDSFVYDAFMDDEDNWDDFDFNIK